MNKSENSYSIRFGEIPRKDNKYLNHSQLRALGRVNFIFSSKIDEVMRDKIRNKWKDRIYLACT